MKFRAITVNTPTFVHEGIDINGTWSEVDTDNLTDEGRKALITYRDKLFQVHPDDVARFNAESGSMPGAVPSHANPTATTENVGEDHPLPVDEPRTVPHSDDEVSQFSKPGGSPPNARPMGSKTFTKR